MSRHHPTEKCSQPGYSSTVLPTSSHVHSDRAAAALHAICSQNVNAIYHSLLRTNYIHIYSLEKQSTLCSRRFHFSCAAPYLSRVIVLVLCQNMAVQHECALGLHVCVINLFTPRPPHEGLLTSATFRCSVLQVFLCMRPLALDAAQIKIHIDAPLRDQKVHRSVINALLLKYRPPLVRCRPSISQSHHLTISPSEYLIGVSVYKPRATLYKFLFCSPSTAHYDLSNFRRWTRTQLNTVTVLQKKRQDSSTPHLLLDTTPTNITQGRLPSSPDSASPIPAALRHHDHNVNIVYTRAESGMSNPPATSRTMATDINQQG